MVGSENAGRNTRKKEREGRGSPSPVMSFPGDGDLGAATLCEGGASSACVGALWVQRGERELELGLNRIEGEREGK
jgi:hypothetical protein